MNFLRRWHFSKIWPAGSSTSASTLLEIVKTNRKFGGVIFQKSDPPEAAHLLAPCLKLANKFGKSLNIFKGMPFFKIWPAGGSTPASTLLENCKKVRKIHQHFQGDVIFQKSDPPEAAPLLAPCLKSSKKFRKSFTILKGTSFFKNLPRRRQHPC